MLKKWTTFILAVSLLFLFSGRAFAFSKVEISDGSVVALYHLEDVNDSSGNGYTLTNNGTTPFNAALFNNGADGGSANGSKYLSINNAMGITGNTLSINGWVNITTAPTTQFQYAFFSNDVSAVHVNNHLFYGVTAGNKTVTYYRDKVSVGNDQVNCTSDLGTGAWHMITMIADGTAGLIKLYIDGSFCGQTATTGNGAGGDDIKSILGQSDNERWTSGLIDDTVFFNTAIATTTVTSIWNSGSGAEVCVTAGCAGGAASVVPIPQIIWWGDDF